MRVWIARVESDGTHWTRSACGTRAAASATSSARRRMALMTLASHPTDRSCTAATPGPRVCHATCASHPPPPRSAPPRSARLVSPPSHRSIVLDSCRLYCLRVTQHVLCPNVYYTRILLIQELSDLIL